jgi:hypothetical protein
MRFHGRFSQAEVIQTQEFCLRFPVSDSLTLIDHLNSFFAAIPYPGQEYEAGQYSISSFPKLCLSTLIVICGTESKWKKTTVALLSWSDLIWLDTHFVEASVPNINGQLGSLISLIRRKM